MLRRGSVLPRRYADAVVRRNFQASVCRIQEYKRLFQASVRPVRRLLFRCRAAQDDLRRRAARSRRLRRDVGNYFLVYYLTGS